MLQHPVLFFAINVIGKQFNVMGRDGIKQLQKSPVCLRCRIEPRYHWNAEYDCSICFHQPADILYDWLAGNAGPRLMYDRICMLHITKYVVKQWNAGLNLMPGCIQRCLNAGRNPGFFTS